MSIHIGGNATGVQIQLNSPGGQQQQTVTGEYKADALIALLQQVVAEGMLSGRSADQLFSLQALANVPMPSWPVSGRWPAVCGGSWKAPAAQTLGGWPP
ncbi:hypothetical protein C0708_22645 (plasmid) [Aeromonas caviae]|nr:hypothetical protein C0708_22645 [Aeromonas caviae]